MTKNELICKLKFMGFTEDEVFNDTYENKKGITVDFDNENDTVVVTNILKYLEYKDVIKYIITIDK